ncbi:MAG: ATP-binding cassette domain-containing protein [Methanosarcinales archaeon]|nr:ATP-binding cassette domain-containing protein [Methanosarcinales archaeon]
MISIQNLTYCYPNIEISALDNIDLEIHEGEFILLLGPSGCGKSTLIQCLNGIIPKVSGGELEGTIWVNGKDVSKHKVHQMSTEVGIVFQNPDAQLFGLTVEEDVAFGPENLGVEREEILKRVERSLQIAGIDGLRERFTFTLSGGEKQRTAIAGNLAMQPNILVLDEPTSDLDPRGTREVLETIRRLNRELSITIILIEHKLDEVIGLADRTIVMDKGRIILDGKTCDIFTQNLDLLNHIGLYPPHLIRLSEMLHVKPSYRAIFSHLNGIKDSFINPPDILHIPDNGPHVVFEDVRFSYQDGTEVLRGIDLTLRRGEFIAMIGPNGSGKTTLLSCLIGLIKPDKGRVMIDGQDIKNFGVAELAREVGYLFQNPDYQLFADTVWEEVAFGLKTRSMPAEEIDTKVASALDMMQLAEYRDRHPHSLSRGERQRLAVASILSLEPDILVLDEPTTGQDRGHLSKFLHKMKKLNHAGKTIILITHDMSIVAAYADRTVIMKEGNILIDDSTRQVFSRSDLLEQASIEPPMITKLSHQLREGSEKVPVILTISELKDLMGKS